MLDAHLLKYYSTSKDTQPNTSALGELKGVVSLPGCTVDASDPSNADGRPACFKITPKSRKIYYINAKDAATRDEWIEAVRNNSQLQSEVTFAAGAAAGSAGDAADAPLTEEPDAADIKNTAKSSKLEDANVTLADFELLKVIGRGTYGKVMQVIAPSAIREYRERATWRALLTPPCVVRALRAAGAAQGHPGGLRDESPQEGASLRA